MGKTLFIPNSTTHIFLYGYFQHGFQIFCGLKKSLSFEMSHQDLAHTIQMFESLRSKLRGNTHVSPHQLSNIGNLLGTKDLYPQEIRLSDQEHVLFDSIIKINFEEAQRSYRRFFKKNKQKIPDESFSELLTQLRTKEAVEYLRKKFIKNYPIEKLSN